MSSEPKIYAPRMVTTLVYSVVDIAVALLLADAYVSFGDPRLMRETLYLAAGLLAMMPLIYAFDLVSYAMYPAMVDDMRSGRKISIVGAIRRALSKTGHILVMTALIMAFATLAAAPTSLAFIYMRATANPLPLIFAAIMSFFAILAFSVMVFFVIPHAVIEGSSISAAFIGGFRMSRANTFDLAKLNILFALLVSSSMLIVAAARIHDSGTWAAIALFAVIRMLQAVIYTYLCIANPVAYFEAKIK